MLKVGDFELMAFGRVMQRPVLSFQYKESASFEEVWPSMRETVLKVLKQESFSQSEWQELFYCVYLVCLWDEKGAAKIYDCLQKDIVAFIDVSAAHKRH